jgi:hypothetical protein
MPYQTPIFKQVYEGNFTAVEASIKRGGVPVNTVDPYGLGLGYVSVPCNIQNQRLILIQ